MKWLGLGLSLALVGASLLETRAHAAAASPSNLETGPSLGDLLPRLAQHADAFEQMKRRGSYTLTGHVDQLSSDGKPSATKEMVVRVTPSGGDVPRTEVVRYVEDGVDQTSEARRKHARDKEKAPSRTSTRRRAFAIRLPFLASEQPRYTFSIAERDPADPSRVRVAFTPRVPADDAYAGSAWVDSAAGEVLRIGLTPTKNPTFVDRVDVTVTFGLRTPLGLAPQTFSFDARGSFLFVKKRYRGTATIADARFD